MNKDYAESSLIEQPAVSRTRDLRLPKLISGEVDVDKLDTNIPKEVA